MNTISIYELKKISSPIIIDIRDNYSYSISHVKNAINIPYYNSSSVYNIGDIAFHSSTQKLHIFNGNDWIFRSQFCQIIYLLASVILR